MSTQDQNQDKKMDQKDAKDWTVEDAMAVDSTPDSVRLSADPSEPEPVQRNDGAVVDPEVEQDDLDDVEQV